MIRVLVLDDEWYNLEEICALAAKTGIMHVAGRFSDPLTALREAPGLNVQAALIDIELPGMDGLTFAERLLEINPEIVFAFITSFDKYAVRAFDLNALDYVTKPLKEVRFLQLAQKLGRELERQRLGEPDKRLHELYDETGGLPETAGVYLTERETQVIQLLAQGLTQREIAEWLFLSVSSVKKHLENIYQKLRVNNKIMAVQRAREMKFIKD